MDQIVILVGANPYTILGSNLFFPPEFHLDPKQHDPRDKSEDRDELGDQGAGKTGR
ncbi:MAG: hypothetical protein RSB23_01950 [Alistipes sp.]